MKRFVISSMLLFCELAALYAQNQERPNMLIWGDDVGIWNISAYHRDSPASRPVWVI